VIDNWSPNLGTKSHQVPYLLKADHCSRLLRGGTSLHPCQKVWYSCPTHCAPNITQGYPPWSLITLPWSVTSEYSLPFKPPIVIPISLSSVQCPLSHRLPSS
jgi:hypothetical protein